MKAYGVKTKDAGCCPGCDKFPHEAYNNTRGAARRARLRPAKRRARADARREIRVVAGEA